MKQPIQHFLFISAVILAGADGLRAGAISGTVNPGKAGSVVYVEAIPGKTFPAPANPVVMDQKSLLFQPHVMAVALGATVQFLNSDKVQHNIFWPSVNGNKKMSHNMGTWPTGEQRSFKFDTPGVVPLLCNVHPEMSGYIIVSPTPYYAITDASGNFKIADVPDGSYTVSAWHEGAKIQSKPVSVSGNATVEFSLAK
ncbi:MAG: carboxypeptidase regulatory-like domain-containing protein [Bryobacteraceae bacterium]|jgi:plastocyanin